MGMVNYSYWFVKISLKQMSFHDVKAHFAGRFANDKLYYEDEHYLVLVDGIVLNSQILMKDYSFKHYKDIFIHAFNNVDFIQKIIGPYTFCVFDKFSKKCIVTANQTGDTSIFYSYDKDLDVLFLSNNMNVLLPYLNERKINEETAHYLLTYGTSINSGTILTGINRVYAGKFIVIQDGSYNVLRYHKFDFSETNKISFEEAITKIDILFKESLQLCIEKDLEYGYGTILTELSAGLDSRMVNWLIKRVFEMKVKAISYSQSGSEEQKYAMLIAKYLGIPLYYRSLDDLEYLQDVDDIVNQEFGLGFYCGAGCTSDFLNFININDYGLLHTGQIGDVVIGCFTDNNSKTIDIDYKRYSKVLPLRFNPIEEEFNSQEEFLFYTRAVGALSTHFLIANYTYAVSPFLNPEFIQFCISLPHSYRKKHKLYWAWIDKCYPEAGIIPCSRTRKYDGIQFKFAIQSLRRVVFRKLNRIANVIANILHIKDTSASSNNMSPFTFWYETNPQLRNFINNYYKNYIVLLNDYPVLQKEAQILFDSSNAFDKLLVISLLSVINNYVFESIK